MRAGRASRTAEHNALFRALESSRPARRRLFTDPLAREFLAWPLSLVERLGAVPGFGTLVRAGEQLTFGIDPDELAGFLARRGLSLESDVGAADYRMRYYRDAARAMRGHEFYRVALACVVRASGENQPARVFPDSLARQTSPPAVRRKWR
jgi:O-methyltransferase involved in polyketide biosynthesis